MSSTASYLLCCRQNRAPSLIPDMAIPDLLALLDIRTLIVVTALLYFMCTLTLLFVYLNHRSETGLAKFIIANFQINLGLILFALRGLIPDFVSIVIANGAILAGVAYLHHAIRSFYHRPSSTFRFWTVLLVSCALFFYFSQIRPEHTIRILLFSLPFIFFCAAIAHEFLRPTEHETQPGPRLANAGMFILLATFFAMRLALIIQANFLSLPAIKLDSGLLNASPLSAMTWLVLIFTFSYWNVGLLLLVTQKFLARQKQLAMTDSLTGILNRRGFEFMADRVLVSRTSPGRAHFLLLLDIDLFKQVNDQYGHEAGDEVLKQLTESLQGRLRKGDFIGRLGGEEFSILLTDRDAEQVWLIAERLRQQIQMLIIHYQQQSIQITASIGVAESGPDGSSFADLFRVADLRLYQAKHTGRNRIVFSQPIRQFT